MLHRLALKAAAVIGALMRIAASITPLAAADPAWARLNVAARHFADLEDDKAKALLDELSADGIADADVLLGYLYSDPLYEGRDDATAISYFERAAEKDHPEAIFQLAESRYWARYLNPAPGMPAEFFGAVDDEVYRLLKRAIELKHGAAVFRLAMICILEDYDCTNDEIEMSLNVRRTAFGGGAGYLTDPFSALRIVMKEEESFERTRSYLNYLEVGLSFVNPLVAAIGGNGWRHVRSWDRCPSVHHPSAVNRMFAAMNGVERPFPGSLTLEDCYSGAQLKVLEEKVLNFLDGVVSLNGTYQVQHINWCFENRTGRTGATCLVTAAFDDFFACGRLSMASFLKRRGVPLIGSTRYHRCREQMLSARER